MTHGRKPRRPRPARNPIETAMLRATRLTEHEIAETMAPFLVCATRLREGVATRDQVDAVFTAFLIAGAIEAGGIIKGLQGHITAAVQAIEAITLRATRTGAWRPTPLHWHELDAINTMLELHPHQLRALSAAELHGTVQRVIHQRRAMGMAVEHKPASALLAA